MMSENEYKDFKIIDFETLISAYNFVHSDECLSKIESELKPKKIRKNLLNTDYDLIKNFNESLKTIYQKKWINNFHSKDNWINEFILLIIKKSKILINNVEILAGYNEYEKHRLDFDHLIVHQTPIAYIYTTSMYPYDFNTGDEFSDKINCFCLKDICEPKSSLTLDYNIFKKGVQYKYRTCNSDNKIYVYRTNHDVFIFEGDSFYNYFSSSLSRDRKINSILNDDYSY